MSEVRMTEQGYIAEVRRYLLETVGPEARDLADEDPLLGDVLDSVTVLTLVTHLEETYGITIGAHEMDPRNFGTLRAIGQFVARKTAGGSSPPPRTGR